MAAFQFPTSLSKSTYLIDYVKQRFVDRSPDIRAEAMGDRRAARLMCESPLGGSIADRVLSRQNEPKMDFD